METILETQAVSIFLWLLVAGVVLAALGLRFLHTPAITHANRAETARGLFEHFSKEVPDV